MFPMPSDGTATTRRSPGPATTPDDAVARGVDVTEAGAVVLTTASGPAVELAAAGVVPPSSVHAPASSTSAMRIRVG